VAPLNVVFFWDRRASSHILVLLLCRVLLEELAHRDVAQRPGDSVDAYLNSRSERLGVDIVV